MCRRLVEEGEPTPRLVPLWEEDRGPLAGVVVIVDVLCPNPDCLFRDEDTWFARWGLKRGPHRPCGASACLTRHRCSWNVLPPTRSSCSTPPPIRRRYVLKDPSVD
jgi:hypothetical protein